jgi:tripartite-type tricarboxylate transporter receptor subunit TctC
MKKKSERISQQRRLALQALAALCATGLPRISLANEWPIRPVKFINPFVAGGATDTLSRLYAERMSSLLGQQMIVENRSGAGGTVGMSALAMSPADGYMLGMMTNATHVFAKATMKNIPFDAEKNFSFISGLWELPNVLVINPSVKARSVPELVELLKKNPGKFNYASAGLGTSTHISAELFRERAKLDAVHVPYRGGASANVDLMSGAVQMYFDNISGSIENIKSGKVIPLAVTSLARNPALPNVPAMSEFFPDFELTSWTGVAGPADVPHRIKSQIEKLTITALKDPKLESRFASLGATAYIATGDQVRARRATQEAEMLPKLRAWGITPE